MSSVATRAPSPIKATAMCSAVVDLPEPPFSLPITSTCARPACRAGWLCTMLGFEAGWKVLLIFHSPLPREGKRLERGGREGSFVRHSCFVDPNRGVVEHRAAVGPAGIGRRDGVDTDAGLEIAVGPYALDHDHALLLARLGLGVDDG